MNRKIHIPDMIQSDILFTGKNVQDMSNEEILELLSTILERELEDKNEPSNLQLIEVCASLIEELIPDSEKPTEQELLTNLTKIKNSSEKKANIKHRHHRMKPWKVFSLVATLILILCLSLNVVAIQKGYKNGLDFVIQNLSHILGLDSGKTEIHDNITFVKNGKGINYQNIQTLLEAENLNLLYPDRLPENVTLTKVTIIPNNNAQEVIYYVFDTNLYTVKISHHNLIDLDTLSHYTVYECNNRIYYLSEKPDSCQAICYYNEYEYIISAPDTEHIFEIINNLKELK